jgi:hypothetical protein
MLVRTLCRLFGKKPGRRPPPKPLRRLLGLEQLETRDCPSAVTLIASGSWTNPAIWSTGTVPTQYDDVTLSGSYSVCSGGSSVHSLKLDPTYTGTLELWGTLNVNPNGDSTGGLEVDGGTIDQPGGMSAQINVQGGYFNWGGGVINSTATLSALNLHNVTANVTGAGR